MRFTGDELADIQSSLIDRAVDGVSAVRIGVAKVLNAFRVSYSPVLVFLTII